MRLVDEIEDRLRVRGESVLVEPCGLFLDLMWPPYGERDEVVRLAETDPALTVTSYTRWVALARVCGELRFYVAPLPESGDRVRGDRARSAACAAEREYSELGPFATVDDAVELIVRYLGGEPLAAIAVPRDVLGGRLV